MKGDNFAPNFLQELLLFELRKCLKYIVTTCYRNPYTVQGNFAKPYRKKEQLKDNCKKGDNFAWIFCRSYCPLNSDNLGFILQHFVNANPPTPFNGISPNLVYMKNRT